MAKNTSVTIGQHFDSFIQNQIDAGRYASQSEVVRAGLRLLEQQEEKLMALRKALKDGEESGIDQNFDPEQFLASMKQKYSA